MFGMDNWRPSFVRHLQRIFENLPFIQCWQTFSKKISLYEKPDRRHNAEQETFLTTRTGWLRQMDFRNRIE
jgi:hypothetical protein